MSRRLVIVHRVARLLLLAAALLGPGGGARPAGAHHPAAHPAAPTQKAQLFEDLGSYHFPVTTKSALAQRYFDEGLALFYGYNLDEAALSFREAARLDPACAMAWWGVALANGPHMNNPAMEPPKIKVAVAALRKARLAAAKATPRERDYIAALGKRYRYPLPKDTGVLFLAYAEALRGLVRKYPLDNDAPALLAEALFDMAPFDFWTADGRPKNGGDEICTALEGVLAREPRHPGANHFYIHAVEGSKHPERALPAAEILDQLVPGAGHVVHMPAHIFMRTGRYEAASAANRAAIAVDQKYLAKSPNQVFYMMYVAHNYQFLAASAMMEGRAAEALEASLTMRNALPGPMVQEMAPMIDGYLALPYHVMVRFGKWEQLLTEPRPPAYEPFSTALWHYARGMALCGTDRLGDAAAEAESLVVATARVPEGYSLGYSPAPFVLGVALEVLLGQLARQGDRATDAVRHFTAAVALEDSLHYDEPADWIPPVRHYLGAVLLKQGRAVEAAQVYSDDLERNPENGWALFGLGQAQAAAGAADDAARTRTRFDAAWSRSDVKLEATAY